MNRHQKDNVIRLRKESVGYKKISTILGVNLNTVKSFCRNKELTTSALDTISKCKN
ncbi:Zinc-finger protein [Streptococcus dysgalactiae]|nr:Zinc-finger protein [Streptococcus dysgalactiae]